MIGITVRNPDGQQAIAPDAYTAIVESPAGDHGYFDTLAARSDSLAAYSLRDQGQIDQYRTKKSQPSNVTYAPATDPDPRRQDAAKVVIPAGAVSLPTQIRVPIPAVSGQSLFVTWDVWLGAEMAFAGTQISRFKAFQFASPSDRIWTEVRTNFISATAPALARIDVRSYGQVGTTLGPNVTDNLPLSPQAAEFGMLPETWTRFWAFFNPVGAWHEVSLWAADSTRAAVRILDRLQLKPNGEGWDSWWLELNTSSTSAPAFDRVAYARNVVMLRGLSDPTTLLVSP